MSQAPCCSLPDRQWTHRVVDRQHADIYYCAHCGRVARTERYLVPLVFPDPHRCVSCGGERQESAGAWDGVQQDPSRIHCTQCGKSVVDDQRQHDEIRRKLQFEGSFVELATILQGLGRRVLALKCATAEIQFGHQPIEGMTQRLHLLEEMELYDEALDEAYEWSGRRGAPPIAMQLVAQIEAVVGNVSGALKALESCIQADPDNGSVWADLAELMTHTDDRPQALRAATKGLPHPESEDRCVAVIVEIAERFYANGLHAEALAACSLCGERQERDGRIAWLRARIAATQQDFDYLIKWLKATVEADPDNADAHAMLEPYLRGERRKSGWFF